MNCTALSCGTVYVSECFLAPCQMCNMQQLVKITKSLRQKAKYTGRAGILQHIVLSTE